MTLRLHLAAVPAFIAATSCCCCGDLFQRIGTAIDELTGEHHSEFEVPEEPVADERPEPEAPKAPPVSERLLKGDLAAFEPYPDSRLKDFAQVNTITSATLAVPAEVSPRDVVDFYRQAAEERGYFIDSRVNDARSPSFEAIRGNVNFRVVARVEGDEVVYSLAMQKTI